MQSSRTADNYLKMLTELNDPEKLKIEIAKSLMSHLIPAVMAAIFLYGSEYSPAVFVSLNFFFLTTSSVSPCVLVLINKSLKISPSVM